MNLFEMYRAGGPFMHLISVMGLLTLIIIVLKIKEVVTRKTGSGKLLSLILMSGSVALAIGFLAQIVGITLALSAIRDAADVSPQIVFNGAILSFYAPIWGLIVFIFSTIAFYILREITNKQMVY